MVLPKIPILIFELCSKHLKCAVRLTIPRLQGGKSRIHIATSEAKLLSGGVYDSVEGYPPSVIAELTLCNESRMLELFIDAFPNNCVGVVLCC